MDGNSVLLFLLILSAVIQDVEAARLTITPSQSLPAGSTSLTLRCSPVSNAVYTVLYSVSINKRTLVQNSQTTVMAVIDGKGTKPGTGITTPKYTVTGNYDIINQQPTQAFLQVVINNPNCNDSVEYQCITTGQPTVSSNPSTLQEDKNVTVQSNPGMVEMIRFQEKIRYDIGEKIEITCQGDVGNPEKLWSWESKSVGDSFFIRITENITKGQVDPPSSTRCGYYSRSILNYYVGQGDNGLEIRCKVDNSDQYSANKTIYVTCNHGTVEMTRFQEKIRYDVGEKIEITCQGDVGNPEKAWSWESKSVGDSFFNRITENITKGQVDPPTPTRCGYYSRSRLTYYVGQGDNGLEIRCKVDNSDQYGANKTIYVTCNPGTVEMIRSPAKMKYDFGEKIKIACHGDVGNPEKFWSWESKSVGESLFKRITVNITKGRVDPPTSTRCGYYSRSILDYYVGQGDDGLEIRCKVDNSDQYSANETIYLTGTIGTIGDSGSHIVSGAVSYVSGIMVMVMVSVVY